MSHSVKSMLLNRILISTLILLMNIGICDAKNDNWSELANMQQKVIHKNQLYQQIPIIHLQVRGKINSLIAEWNRFSTANQSESGTIIDRTQQTLLEAANLIVYADKNICGSYEKKYGDSSDICSKSRDIERQMSLMAQEREFFINYINTGNCSKYSGFSGKKIREFSCDFMQAKELHLNGMLHYAYKVRDKLIF